MSKKRKVHKISSEQCPAWVEGDDVSWLWSLVNCKICLAKRRKGKGRK